MSHFVTGIKSEWSHVSQMSVYGDNGEVIVINFEELIDKTKIQPAARAILEFRHCDVLKILQAKYKHMIHEINSKAFLVDEFYSAALGEILFAKVKSLFPWILKHDYDIFQKNVGDSCGCPISTLALVVPYCQWDGQMGIDQKYLSDMYWKENEDLNCYYEGFETLPYNEIVGESQIYFSLE